VLLYLLSSSEYRCKAVKSANKIIATFTNLNIVEKASKLNTDKV
jgi:hypothetical protein